MLTSPNQVYSSAELSTYTSTSTHSVYSKSVTSHIAILVFLGEIPQGLHPPTHLSHNSTPCSLLYEASFLLRPYDPSSQRAMIELGIIPSSAHVPRLTATCVAAYLACSRKPFFPCFPSDHDLLSIYSRPPTTSEPIQLSVGPVSLCL